jgi:hypothetical protein
MVHTHQIDEKVADCIQECLSCLKTCTESLSRHCLEVGGKHVEADHVRLMMDCIDICGLSANFMMRGSPRHHSTCRLCAEICSACAKDCERVGDMDKCVEACNRCATSCSVMTGK